MTGTQNTATALNRPTGVRLRPPGGIRTIRMHVERTGHRDDAGRDIWQITPSQRPIPNGSVLEIDHLPGSAVVQLLLV